MAHQNHTRNEEKWTRPDRMARFGLWVNITLAAFTALLFWIAFDDSQTAKKSADAATNAATISKKTFDETKKYNDSSLTIQQNSFDSNNADSRKRFTKDSIALALQLSSLKETQKEFNIENRAYIQVKEFKIIPLPNKHIGIQFIVANIGNQPAKILSGFYHTFSDTSTYTKYNQVINVFKKNEPTPNKENLYITKEAPQMKVIALDRVIDSVMLTQINNGYWNFYIHGELIYVDLMNGKKKRYEFATEISGKNLTFYNMIYNENFNIESR